LDRVTKRRKPNGRAKRWSGSARAALAILVLAALAAGAGAWLVLWPYGPSGETFVDITPGSSSALIGYDLEAAGIVRSRYAFDALRLLKGGTLKAGEYRFDHPAPATEVYARIARGDVFTTAVTIPEGANIFDIAQRLTQAGLDGGQDFIHAQAQNLDLVADLDPDARSLEGYLFPDTYRFGRKTTPLQMQATMVKRFREVAGQIGLKQNLHNVVTMASLVERETAVDDERPLVASVFFNRLDKNMPLETDPSVIYGLEMQGLWRGAIYASDLTRDTPYNTYMHQGLPPGPVDNPGVKSLRAAMDPARSDYLYFVAAGADAQGKSLFSTTLEEHNRKVAEYRQALKRAGGQ
jgi:UPF0755 protein